MIHVTNKILIDENEIEYRFIRSSGPGGQNVNKVSTAVQLRYNVSQSVYLSDEMKARLSALAGKRMTSDGILIVEAKRHRTQERNRKDALDRLIMLMRNAATPPKQRRPTRPTKASKRRRLDTKKRRSLKKSNRRYRPELD